jgi:hypothetical protein
VQAGAGMGKSDQVKAKSNQGGSGAVRTSGRKGHVPWSIAKSGTGVPHSKTLARSPNVPIRGRSRYGKMVEGATLWGGRC